MQTQKSIIVYYGDATGIDKTDFSKKDTDGRSEIFLVQDHHKEEVPGEYYDNPQEYYRIKFKQRGYEVSLQTYQL